MAIHRRNVLLLIVGTIVSAMLYIAYDLHKVFFAWFWSIEDTISLLAQIWIVRRIERPISNLFVRCGIIWAIGYDRYGRFKRWVLRPLRAIYDIFLSRWPYMPTVERVLISCCSAAIIGAFIWLTWFVPYVLPVSAYVVRKLYWWGSDQFCDRTLYDFGWKRFRNRATHTNKAIRWVLKPWRFMRMKVEPWLEKMRERRHNKKRKQ